MLGTYFSRRSFPFQFGITTVAAVFSPTVLFYFARNDLDGLMIFLRRAIKCMGLVLALPIALMCGFSEPLLRLWLGPGFSEYSPLLFLMAATLLVPRAALLMPLDAGTLQIGGESIDTSWFLILGALLFSVGSVGILVRRNPLVILVCIELMLNAVNLTLVTFSRQLQNLDGQLFALMSLTVAAAEAVVGLGILVDIFKLRELEDVDDLSELKG